MIKTALAKTLDLLLPPLCLSCDAPVAEDRTLCPGCWGKIHFIVKPFCSWCGEPFEVPVDEGTLCGSCISTCRISSPRARRCSMTSQARTSCSASSMATVRIWRKTSPIGKKSFLPDLLLCQRATPPQGEMNRKDRLKNVKGTFTVKTAHKSMLQNKAVILVDDVLTTGATVDECARILLETRAKAVNVLTLSRVRGYL